NTSWKEQENAEKKRRNIVLKTIEESSDSEEDESENLNLLVKKFGKFLKKKNRTGQADIKATKIWEND
ncbi:unnamed protein product, partial [Sphenostylis stenocarpa]